MEYQEFKALLQPALEILIKQNLEFEEQFGTGMFTLQTASEAELLNFEDRFNLSIPIFYKTFLKEFNPFRLEIMFHGIYGLKEMETALEHLREYSSVLNFLPIVSDNSGNYYGIFENDNTIYIADHEERYRITGYGSIKIFFEGLVNEKVKHYNLAKDK